MNKKKRSFMAVVLVFILSLSSIPLSGFAATDTGSQNVKRIVQRTTDKATKSLGTKKQTNEETSTEKKIVEKGEQIKDDTSEDTKTEDTKESSTAVEETAETETAETETAETETTETETTEIETAETETVETETEEEPQNLIANYSGGTDAPSNGQISLVKFVDAKTNNLGGMALDSSGYIWSWGYNLHGMMGTGMGDATGSGGYQGGMKRIPYFPQNGIKITQIETGYHTNYAIDQNGVVYAWGRGLEGQMGNGTTTTNNNVPKVVTSLSGIKIKKLVTSIEAASFTYAISEDGKVYAWGYASYGDIPGKTGYVTQATEITMLSTIDVADISLGNNHVLVLDTAGKVYSYGFNVNGQLGHGNVTSLNTYKQIDALADKTIVKISSSTNSNLALADDGSVYQWGAIYKTTTPTNVTTPELVQYDYGSASYTPLAANIAAGRMVNYIIDQHGRVWSWGFNIYYSWGTDGGLDGKLNKYVSLATQMPTVMGDGDTQGNVNMVKGPVFSGVTSYLSFYYTFPSYLKYGQFSGIGDGLHPTIYDKKYSVVLEGNDPTSHKDDYLLDKDGNRIIYVIKRETDGTYSGNYYIAEKSYTGAWAVDNSGSTSLPAGVTNVTSVPVIKDEEQAWIGTAVDLDNHDWTGYNLKEVPYISNIDTYQSSTLFIDKDGNLYKTGLDGSGSVAWGWDYSVYEDGTAGNNTQYGLYNMYTYEIMYMRGAPTISQVDIVAEKPKEKIYLTSEDISENAKVTIDFPKTNYNDALGANIYSEVSSIKYVFVPYDTENADFNVDMNTITEAEFNAIYNKYAEKGDLLEGKDPLVSSNTENLKVELDVPVSDNGRMLIWVTNVRYSLEEGLPNTEANRGYTKIDYVTADFTTDNFYTPTILQHVGKGEMPNTNPVEYTEIYSATQDNVKKQNVDNVSTEIYGLPLDVNGNVIGTTVDENGDVTVVKEPTFGYDNVKIQSYEEVANVEWPSGISPYWKFKEFLEDTILQPTSEEVVLNNKFYLPKEEEGETHYYQHDFIYEPDMDYFTNVDGEKTWDDMDNVFGYRPESIQLTLKQYERDTTTGAIGAFIKDIKTITVTANQEGKWYYDFGVQVSYEYTYRIEEAPIEHYEVSINYDNVISNPVGTNDDFSNLQIVNNLHTKPIRFTKVDDQSKAILTDSATFVLKNTTEGGKVLDQDGKQVDQLEFTTELATGTISVPFQPKGSYILTEMKAPSGYNLLTKDITIEIGGEKIIVVKLGDNELEQITLTEEEQKEFSAAYHITNRLSAILPQTGGSGSLWYIISGGALMLMASVWMTGRVKNKKDFQ